MKHAALRLARRLTWCLWLLSALALAQVPEDATNEAQAARLMLDNQAIVEASATACKAAFSERVAEIDTWLQTWRASQSDLVAAAERINAVSNTPSLGVERRAHAEAEIAPVFAGRATPEQQKAFCTQLFQPGTQDRLRDSQPQTVHYLMDAYARMTRSGELSK